MAASKLGLTEVPCMTAKGWSEAQRRAYVIADNKLSLNAGWDDDLLKIELADLTELGFNLDLTGFPEAEITNLFNPPSSYSRKVEAPIYTPADEQPAISDLRDETKADSLKAAIREADLPEDVAAFLLSAAERHTVFHFQRIADFYAHAPPEQQRLFEASGLVIIDLDAAIESGFVAVNQMLLDMVEDSDEADADAA
jgi:ParB-like chromosome segregation protein Spo0J